MSLIGILVGIIIVGVLLWACSRLLAAFAVTEPLHTIIWVLVVVVSLVLFLQFSGLYSFGFGEVRVR